MLPHVAVARDGGMGEMPSRYRMALITGASSGIGAAFSEALPPETGLLLTGRNAERLHAVADRIYDQWVEGLPRG